MKTIVSNALVVFLCAILSGCGGGGGNPGKCSGSAAYCAQVSGASGSPAVTPPPAPATSFSQAGTGDSTFLIPVGVKRLRVQASTTANASNFIVKLNGNPIINVILGAGQLPVAQEGTYLVQGGETIQIVNSAGVSWQFDQVQPPAASGIFPYTQSGTGDAVFEIPVTVTRLRIRASYAGKVSNFIVRINGSYVVNTIIGTTEAPTDQDGTYVLSGGGTVEIISSGGVAWTFSEV